MDGRIKELSTMRSEDVTDWRARSQG